MNILHIFLNELEGVRDSFDGFQAAWKGNLSDVKEFINKYPTLKDQPGPWGTTLLYSAARNNLIPLVKYLVDDAQCSVNAQNQQHIERALSKEMITDPNYQVLPRHGSTALHAACFGGHLDIVKYLIQHNANYYIRNQAEETAIMNGEHHQHIIEYFQNFLNLGYTKREHDFPSTAIVEGTNQSIKDCLWKYKL
jgi:ankyrin repeat protein